MQLPVMAKDTRSGLAYTRAKRYMAATLGRTAATCIRRKQMDFSGLALYSLKKWTLYHQFRFLLTDDALMPEVASLNSI